MEKVKTLLFDTFGTVTDWHSTVNKEGARLAEKYSFNLDWDEFGNRWRDEGYMQAIFDVAHGLREWEPVDAVFYKSMQLLFADYGVKGISQEDAVEFSRLWHRIGVWDDVLTGLARLKKKYFIAPFTNGDFGLIADMSRSSALPWDYIITANIFKKFKPDPTVYTDCLDFIGLTGEEVLFVSAHPFDMDGAKNAGCYTAFVPRPLEYGLNSSHEEPEGETEPDIIAEDFIRLADILKCDWKGAIR